MTHRDIRSFSGALAVVPCDPPPGRRGPRDPSLLFWVAADVLQGRKADRRSPFADIVLKLDRHAGSLSRAIAHAESLLDLPREQALAALVEEANRHGAEPVCKRPTMGFPPACIPTCLYLLLTTSSFEEAVTEVVNLGGDTDTSGAILGASPGPITESTRSPNAGSTASRIAKVSRHVPSRWRSGQHAACTSLI